MSVVIEELTERQLRIGVFKVALSLATVLILGALIVSFFLPNDGKISNIVISALLFAVAMSILANGVLAILRVIDWFEKRRALKVTKNG